MLPRRPPGYTGVDSTSEHDNTMLQLLMTMSSQRAEPDATGRNSAVSGCDSPAAWETALTLATGASQGRALAARDARQPRAASRATGRGRRAARAARSGRRVASFARRLECPGRRWRRFNAYGGGGQADAPAEQLGSARHAARPPRRVGARRGVRGQAAPRREAAHRQVGRRGAQRDRRPVLPYLLSY